MAFNEHEVSALSMGEALARKDHHFAALAKAANHTLEPELELLAWALALKLNPRLYETDEFLAMSRVHGDIFRRAGPNSPVRYMHVKVEAWLKPPVQPVRVGDEVFYEDAFAKRSRVVVIAINRTQAWVQADTGLSRVVALDELHHS